VAVRRGGIDEGVVQLDLSEEQLFINQLFTSLYAPGTSVKEGRL
jgi:hypothetical protein